jgi:hypothetical protein
MLYFSGLFKTEHIVNKALQILHLQMLKSIVACTLVAK